MTTELVVASSSVVIAAFAFVVSIWERIEERRHHRLSVTPRLRIDLPFSATEPVRVRLTNSGVGPAVVQKFLVRTDGDLIPPDARGQMAPVIERIGLQRVSFRYAPCAGDAFPAGEAYDLIRFTLDEAGVDWTQAMERLRRVHIEIEYESIYGDVYALKATGIGTPVGEVENAQT